VELCVKHAAGRVSVVADIDALSTPDDVDSASHAGRIEASALMVVHPFYNPVNLTRLKETFSERYKASQLPIVHCNIPSASDLALSFTEMASLS
jgi:dihydrodipicolinate synthase/N-acetylneuraminate lyase